MLVRLAGGGVRVRFISLFKDEGSHLYRIIMVDGMVRATGIVFAAVVASVVFLFAATSGHATALYTRVFGITEWGFLDTLHAQVDIGEDGSLGEILGYSLAFFAATFFFLAFTKYRRPVLLFLALLMAFVLVDDAARYHERFGGFLVDWLNLPAAPRLRRQDTGEVLAWGLAALVLTPLFFGSLRRRRAGDLGVLALMSIGFGALVFFGIVVDLLHVAVPKSLGPILGLIEDGGEMLAIAFIATLALGLWRNGKSYYETLNTSVRAHQQA